MTRDEELSVLKFLFHGSIIETKQLLGRNLTRGELYRLAKDHAARFRKPPGNLVPVP